VSGKHSGSRWPHSIRHPLM